MIKVSDGQVTEAKDGELLIVERSSQVPASPRRLDVGVYYRYKGATKPLFALSPSGGGGSAWGSISGNINAQTDLKLALDAKANADDLGAVAFSNNYNDLDNKPDPINLCEDLEECTNFQEVKAKANAAYSPTNLPPQPALLHVSFDEASVAATTAETILLTSSQILPAKWKENAAYELKYLGRFNSPLTTATGQSVVRCYMNTTPDLSGSPILLREAHTRSRGNLNDNAGFENGGIVGFDFNLYKKNNILKWDAGAPNLTTGSDDYLRYSDTGTVDVVQGKCMKKLTFDFTQTWHLIFTAQNAGPTTTNIHEASYLKENFSF